MNTTEVLLKHIVGEWLTVRSDFRPPLVWIRLYPQADDPETMISCEASFPQRVWLLTQSQMQERSPWDWRRLYTLLTWPRYAGGFNTDWPPPRDLGYAAFAPYAEPHEFYVETIWGVRWGLGCRVRVKLNGKIVVLQNLWRS